MVTTSEDDAEVMAIMPQEGDHSAEESVKSSVALIHKQTACFMHMATQAKSERGISCRSKLYDVSLNITADHVVVDGLLFEDFMITAQVVLERVG